MASLPTSHVFLIWIRSRKRAIADIRTYQADSFFLQASMIPALVESAFQTGYLSVESEGLIRQMLDAGSCRPTDLKALQNLYDAISAGHVRREAHRSLEMPRIRRLV